ncbi:MAG: hypothetical protein ACAI38_13075 [Myxococcota bacterium]
MKLPIIALLVAVLLVGSSAEAGKRKSIKPGSSPGRVSFFNQVKSHFTNPRISAIVKNDPDAQEGLLRMLATVGKQHGNDEALKRLGKAITNLDEELGPDAAKAALADYAKLSRQFAGDPVATERLEGLAREFAVYPKDPSRGAAFAIHESAKNLPNSLIEIEPAVGGAGRDHLKFRDARRRDGAREADQEFKSWHGTERELGANKLCYQTFRHFGRYQKEGVSIHPVPPGRALEWIFDKRLPTAWRRSIKQCTLDALRTPGPVGPGLSAADAKRWVEDNLVVTVRRKWP